MSVRKFGKFGNWFRDRSLMIDDILYITGKGINKALIFPQDKTRRYAPQKYELFYRLFNKPTKSSFADFGPEKKSKM